MIIYVNISNIQTIIWLFMSIYLIFSQLYDYLRRKKYHIVGLGNIKQQTKTYVVAWYLQILGGVNHACAESEKYMFDSSTRNCRLTKWKWVVKSVIEHPYGYSYYMYT